MCGLTCLKAGPAFQKLPLKRHKSPLKLSGKAFIFTSETTYMEELQPHPKVLATLQVTFFFSKIPLDTIFTPTDTREMQPAPYLQCEGNPVALPCEDPSSVYPG